MKLNIGAGNTTIEGYTPIDIANGQDARRLGYADNSCDEVYASHILEHFGNAEVAGVLAEWVRVLKPGGELRIAVPDVLRITAAYQAGEELNIQGYLMGGQTDGNDFHKTIFDEESLRDSMIAAGLVNIRPWKAENNDCASLPISLNLCGNKLIFPRLPLKVGVAMSLPRVGWTDTFFSCLNEMSGFGFLFSRNTGAYWGQCLTRCMEKYEIQAPDLDAILTVDFDSIFTRQDVWTLLDLMVRHPEAAVIAPIQSGRQREFPLFTTQDLTATGPKRVEMDLSVDLVPIFGAHFGLTLIRTSALKTMPKPWFCEHPDENGRWEEGHIDADIHFWRQLQIANLQPYLAPRVVIGHIETVVSFPDRKLQKMFVDSTQYFEEGKPEEVWQ